MHYKLSPISAASQSEAYREIDDDGTSDLRAVMTRTVSKQNSREVLRPHAAHVHSRQQQQQQQEQDAESTGFTITKTTHVTVQSEHIVSPMVRSPGLHQEAAAKTWKNTWR